MVAWMGHTYVACCIILCHLFAVQNRLKELQPTFPIGPVHPLFLNAYEQLEAFLACQTAPEEAAPDSMTSPTLSPVAALRSQ
jgi:hypothetical protein